MKSFREPGLDSRSYTGSWSGMAAASGRKEKSTQERRFISRSPYKLREALIKFVLLRTVACSPNVAQRNPGALSVAERTTLIPRIPFHCIRATSVAIDLYY